VPAGLLPALTVEDIMSHTLLVWETIPEETDFYLIPNEVAKDYEHYLKEAHHRFINADKMNEGLAFLNTALGDEMAEAGMCAYLGIFREYKVDHKKPLLDKNITAVYLSGFIL
jgi:hypothetical protein